MRDVRIIFDLPAENAKIQDCMAERGRFEPPRPLQDSKDGIQPEFGALFGPNKKHLSWRDFGENFCIIC